MRTSHAACKVCNHPQRSSIEEAIVNGRSNGSISKQYGMSADSVRRHTHGHLAPAMRGALKSREGRAGRTAVQRLESLYDRTEKLLEDAEQGKHGSLALKAIKELRGNIELLARITGELDERPQMNVTLAASPEWAAMQVRLASALEPFPDARVAVAELLAANPEPDEPVPNSTKPHVIHISEEEYEDLIGEVPSE